MLYVGLKNYLEKDALPAIFIVLHETSAKGRTRLKRSQISIIFTYEVFGKELDTLMNL